MQIERIAKLRNQKRQESRQEKSLSISDRRSDENEVFGAKSKRIGKVVIKLRNGKKLVVKKRRKLHNEHLKPTTQKPVLVTVKSRGNKKSKISSRSRGQQQVSSRPNDIFSSEEDQGISVFSLGDPRQDPKILRQQQQQQQRGLGGVTPPPISFVTTPSPSQAKHNFPAIIVTPRSEQGIRTSSQIFESNKVIETEEEAEQSEELENDDEFDYYDYYDDYNDVTSEREEEQFRSEPAPGPPPAQPRPRFSSSTFPPPEERFADIEQEDLNNFSNFPAGSAQRQTRPQVSLDQLRQELLQTQFSPGVNTQPPVTSTAAPQGARVTIGLKASDDRGRGQFAVTPAVPTPSPSSLPASNSVFSQPLTRTGPRFGQRAPTPSPLSFSPQSAVPTPAPVTRPRFQTTFSPSQPTAAAPQIRSQQPSQAPVQPGQRFSGNQRFQQISQNVQSSVILPEITRKPEVLDVQQQREKNVVSHFESNSVVAAGRGEQSRTLNIFDNKARVKNNFDQTPQLLSNFSPKQSQNSEKITGVNQQFRGAKQETFVSDEVNSSADNFKDFRFESLPSRFASAISSNQNAFFFGPPSQTINMRDGSYTIITVLS